MGIIGLIVDNATLAALVSGFDTSISLGAIISKELSIIIMFFLNEYYTFADRRTPGEHIRQIYRFAKSNAVRAVGGAIGIAVLLFVNNVFGIWYLAANIIGIATGFFANYTLESIVTWKVHRA
ncbi:GtrA family protein [Halobacterium salinarum]|nr:GtrA family protein [Halobacterium salinarum]